MGIRLIRYLRLLLTSTALIFGSPVALRVCADVTIQEIVENVRRNEMLYDNIDVTMHFEYTFPGPTPKFEHGYAAASTSITTHYVRQDGMYRLDDVGATAAPDGQRSEDRMGAFDGTQTRLYRHEGVANVIDGLVDDTRRIDPHRVLLRPNVEACVPLSVFLSGESAVRNHPLAQSIHALPEGFGLASSYQGETEVNGLRCHRVWNVMTNAEGSAIHRYELLLAEDRNYLPLRMVLHTFSWSLETPVGEAEVTELREIAPGIWFPYSAHNTAYDQMHLRETGAQRVAWRESYTYENVSLEPQYPRDYFSNLPFADGTHIFKVENGVIRRVGTSGRPLWLTTSSLRNLILWSLNIGLLGLVIVRIVTSRRRAARKTLN